MQHKPLCFLILLLFTYCAHSVASASDNQRSISSDEVIVDQLYRYIHGDVFQSLDQLVSGRNVDHSLTPSSVTLFVDAKARSLISLCTPAESINDCDNRLVDIGDMTPVTFDILAPYEISELSLLARGIVIVRKVIFHL